MNPCPTSSRSYSTNSPIPNPRKPRSRNGSKCVQIPSTELQSSLIEAVPNLRAFGISLCGDVDRADDLVQETLVKAWKNIGSFNEGTNLKAWLFTILRNTYFSELRRNRREVSVDDSAIEQRLSVHPEQQGAADFSDFKKALMQLSDDQREALVLVGAEGFSYEEAAEISGCAVGTVKSRVNRARGRLGELLGVNDSSEFGPDATSTAALVSFKS
ncbi:MAG: sigma-70 family RNA polymerase sigma factor [Hyphomicrobiaceae bacterium]|nr:sigma-70 family RNA polymerase sigma factor [Hyphomicrobiaceae bacterium]